MDMNTCFSVVNGMCSVQCSLQAAAMACATAHSRLGFGELSRTTLDAWSAACASSRSDAQDSNNFRSGRMRNRPRPLSSALDCMRAALALRSRCKFASCTSSLAALPVVAREMLFGLLRRANAAWLLYHKLFVGGRLASFAPASIAAPVFVRRVLVSWSLLPTLTALFHFLASLHARAAPTLPARFP